MAELTPDDLYNTDFYLDTEETLKERDLICLVCENVLKDAHELICKSGTCAVVICYGCSLKNCPICHSDNFKIQESPIRDRSIARLKLECKACKIKGCFADMKKHAFEKHNPQKRESEVRKRHVDSEEEEKEEKEPIEDKEHRNRPKSQERTDQDAYIFHFRFARALSEQGVHKDKTFKERGEASAYLWNTLSLAEKQVYGKQALEDRKRYEKEKASLPKPPRLARNAYMCFCASRQDPVSRTQWHQLTAAEKQIYVDLAEKDKERYETEKRKWDEDAAKRAAMGYYNYPK